MQPRTQASRANPLILLAAALVFAGSGFACAQEPAVPTPGAHPAVNPAADPTASPAATPTLPDAPVPAPAANPLLNPAAAAIATPIAIVPVEGVELSGALDVAQGKAVIGTSGTVTAGRHTATITLPHRGELNICATTKVSLTADSSVQTTEAPGLMMALDRGALEAKFATGKNSDVVLTPDFRILISGPGVADVRVRLGEKGDTCVDNGGDDAPYVAVSSVFDGGVYRVQPGQRVMFQHGSLNEVVDNERESCGCPPEPPTLPDGNQFPVAQSAGLAPLMPATEPQAGEGSGGSSAQMLATLAYNASKSDAAAAPKTANPPALVTVPGKSAAGKPAAAKPDAPNPPVTLADAAADAQKPTPPPQPKKGALRKIGRFFKRLFGG